jgi:flagellar motor switch protein FliN/FliY
MTQDEIDALINSGALEEDESASQNAFESDSGSQAESQSGLSIAGGDPKLELLFDLQLPVSIELGRTNMLIKDILRLGRGSVIEFDKLVSEPVDVIINGKKVAEGEVVVIDKHFGIRVTTLIDPAERMKAGRK